MQIVLKYILEDFQILVKSKKNYNAELNRIKKSSYLQKNLILKYMLVMDLITKQQKYLLKLMKFKNLILVILLLESLFFLVLQKLLKILKRL